MVSVRMMKIETLNNDSFNLLNVEGAAVKVRALPMSDAVAWSALATNATRTIEKANTYKDMRDAMVECAEVLKQYPGIAETVVDKCTTDQIASALEALLEVNDPFARRRRQAEREAAKNMELMSKLPPETLASLLQKHMDGTSAQSELNFTQTLG